MSIRPAVSFVIPAFNAQGTLGETLASLRAQSRGDWEAVIVDDASSDGTLALARAEAAADLRIRVVAAAHGGVSRARNAGIELASADWIVFLDADDRIAPSFLEVMLDAAADDADVVYCGYERVSTDGQTNGTSFAPEVALQPFEVLGRRCAVAIHAVMTRRQAIVELGGFDPNLVCCEDWDLWQRLARTGRRFVAVDKILSIYKTTAFSLSRNFEQLLIDGLTLFERSFGPDARLPPPWSDHTAGLDPAGLPNAKTHLAVWCAAAEVGLGGDGAALLARHPVSTVVGEDPKSLANTIATALMAGRETKADRLFPLPADVLAQLGRLLDHVVMNSECRDHPRPAILALERWLLTHASYNANAVLSRIAMVAVDIEHIEAIEIPSGVDLAILNFIKDDHLVLRVETPVLGSLSAWDVANIAHQGLGTSAFVRLSGLQRRGVFWLLCLLLAGREAVSILGKGLIGWRPVRPLVSGAKRRVGSGAVERLTGSVQPSAHANRVADILDALPKDRSFTEAVLDKVAAQREEPADAVATWNVPVLAYHRIAAEGPEALQQWRVTPEAFTEQLRRLRSLGFYGITSSELIQYRSANKPIPGRPILITFDDAYEDFATTAWPILQRNDFSAEVFVVTDRAGDRARWDARFGEPAPLMDWPTIQRLHGEGVAFGSHMASHTPAFDLTSTELLAEAVSSRAGLEQALQAPVRSIAAPHGAIDNRFNWAIGQAGYWIGFTCEEGVADIRGELYAMPRIEVKGGWSADDLETALRAAGALAGQTSEELVSVVIPAYNAQDTLDETLRSVRAQTYTNLEIIVVDDGSRDSTVEIVRAHAAQDARIRLLTQENGGVARARNHGVREARGELVAPVDSDDLWAPTKLEKQVRAMQSGGPSVGLVYTWYATIDRDGAIIEDRRRPHYEGWILRQICTGNFVGNGSSPLMRKQIVLDCGGYEPDLRDRKAQGCEDLLLYFRIAEHYQFALLREDLTGYRQLDGAMSGDVFQMLRSYQIVADEMRQKHPEFDRQTRMGEAHLACWLFWKAVRARRWEPALRLSWHVFRTDLYVGMSEWAPSLLKGARNRYRESRVGKPDPSRFEIGEMISRAEAA